MVLMIAVILDQLSILLKKGSRMIHLTASCTHPKSASASHLVVDVVGYFAADPNAGTLGYPNRGCFRIQWERMARSAQASHSRFQYLFPPNPLKTLGISPIITPIRPARVLK